MQNTLSPTAIIARSTGLSFFAFYPPFLAAIFNEWLDMVDVPLSPGITSGYRNSGYQTSDKLLDTVLYGFWTLFSIQNPKWFTPYLLAAYLFRVVGIVLFLATGNYIYMLLFPNFFLLWYIYLYFIDYYGIAYDGRIMVALVVIKIVHEYVLHNVSGQWRRSFEGVWWRPYLTLAMGGVLLIYMLTQIKSNSARMFSILYFIWLSAQIVNTQMNTK